MNKGAEPVSRVPLDTEVLIFALRVSPYWMRAMLTWPKHGRSAKPRWKLLTPSGHRVGYMHIMFQPDRWMPIGSGMDAGARGIP